MAIKDSLLTELKHEAPITRRYLERVPPDRLSWKPHDKSMTLGRLASHIGALPGWGAIVLGEEGFDMAPPGSEPRTEANLDDVEQILALYDENLEKMRTLLASTEDEDFMRMWTLKRGGQEVFSAPRVGVLRTSVLNHLVHHRAQLSVYLRLNDVAVPPSYGPTADEEM